MSRFSAIPLVCLVGVVFAMGALAKVDIDTAEASALDNDYRTLVGLAGSFKIHPDDHMSEADRTWYPIINHLIRSIERTRRHIIAPQLKISKGLIQLKGDLIRVHYQAYEAVNMQIVELAKAVSNVNGRSATTNDVEDLLQRRIEQVLSY